MTSTPRIVIARDGAVKLNGTATPLTVRKDAAGVYRLRNGSAAFGPASIVSLTAARAYLASLSDDEIASGRLIPEGSVLVIEPGGNLNVPLLQLEIPPHYSGPIITVTLRNTGADDIEVTLPEGDVPIGGTMLVKIRTRVRV